MARDAVPDSRRPRKLGRPPGRGLRVAIRLEVVDYERVKAAANASGVALAEVARLAIRCWATGIMATPLENLPFLKPTPPLPADLVRRTFSTYLRTQDSSLFRMACDRCCAPSFQSAAVSAILSYLPGA